MNKESDRSLTIAILAGGKSLRMGQDKALLQHPSGVPWVVAIAQLGVQIASRVLVVTGKRLRYTDLTYPENVEIICDDDETLGPVGGIQTAFRRLTSQFLLVIPCDMPHLLASDLQFFLKFACADVVHFHPKTYFPILISREVHFPAGKHSIRAFLTALHAKEYPSAPEIAQFNRPEELELAGNLPGR